MLKLKWLNYLSLSHPQSPKSPLPEFWFCIRILVRSSRIVSQLGQIESRSWHCANKDNIRHMDQDRKNSPRKEKLSPNCAKWWRSFALCERDGHVSTKCCSTIKKKKNGLRGEMERLVAAAAFWDPREKKSLFSVYFLLSFLKIQEQNYRCEWASIESFPPM